MATLNVDDCVIGDRVLLTHPSPHYHIGEFNPIAGTEYEKVGTIMFIGKNSISVKWGIGFSNVYKEGELSLVDAGAVVNMWDEM